MSDKLRVVDFQVTSIVSNDNMKCGGHQRIGNLWVAGAWKPASEGESAGGLPNYKDKG